MSLSILNVGDGDTKLSFDPEKPGELERAKRIVLDMLKLGYAIMVKIGEEWHRATGFDPNSCEYLIGDVAAEAAAEPKPRGRQKSWKSARRVPARTTRSIAVARSAGGMSDRADSIEMRNVERFDAFAGLRNALRDIAADREQWAGIPMPLDDTPLVVEPTYPRAAALMAMGQGAQDQAEAEQSFAGCRKRNSFFSIHKRCDVIIWEQDGKIDWGLHSAVHSLDHQLLTLGSSVAWGIEQEAAALRTLSELLPHHSFKKYLLAGAFVETSKRSGVHYIFRKLRPTVALRSENGKLRILAALCLHPIAYYAGSWAGAMTPTDDVIAHLLLMRGDESMFWKRANQHPGWRPEAGL